jgi:tyrosine-protein kinase Etk/Wzc
MPSMTALSSITVESGSTQEGVHSTEASNQALEISLIDVLTQLAYRKRLIAKVTGIAVLIGLILCFVLPTKYTATTKIMTPQQSSSAAALMSQLSSSGPGSLAVLAGGGLSALKDPNTLYVGLLSSRPVADAIIHKFSLDQAYHAKDMTAARKKLAEDTVVLSEKTGFISIAVTDKDKKRVAAMANAYPEQLRILTQTLAVTEASQRRLFYEQQMNQAKEALLSAELAFQQVQQKKGLVQPVDQAKAVIESIAALHAKVAAKQVEVQALRSYSTERSPELQIAESELSSLQGEAAKLEQQSHSSSFGDIGLADVPGAGLDYLRTEHDAKYTQALYDLLLKQYDAARLDEAKEAAIIQVVEPAIEPDRKSSPNRALIIVVFMALGIFGGCMLALILWSKEIIQSNRHLTESLRKLKSGIMARPPVHERPPDRY